MSRKTIITFTDEAPDLVILDLEDVSELGSMTVLKAALHTFTVPSYRIAHIRTDRYHSGGLVGSPRPAAGPIHGAVTPAGFRPDPVEAEPTLAVMADSIDASMHDNMSRAIRSMVDEVMNQPRMRG